MQAAGGDVAEVSADVAAVGQRRAIAEQQAPDECGDQRASGDASGRRELSAEAGHLPSPGAAITAGYQFDVPVRFAPMISRSICQCWPRGASEDPGGGDPG